MPETPGQLTQDRLDELVSDAVDCDNLHQRRDARHLVQVVKTRCGTGELDLSRATARIMEAIDKCTTEEHWRSLSSLYTALMGAVKIDQADQLNAEKNERLDGGKATENVVVKKVILERTP